MDMLLDYPAMFLNKPAVIEPGMTDEEWATLKKRVDDEGGISKEDYEAERGRLYAGLLPIGSQGCTYIHTLVLNGPHKGRVVNMDMDGEKPRFAFERNFLDWYERWLDEVIAGYLIDNRPNWFGYTMGGDDEHLLRVYAGAEDSKTRLDAIEGLAKLKTATEASCRKLLEFCSKSDGEIRRLALPLLTKFAYTMAREPLRTHIAGDDDDCLVACQSIFWYAKQHSKEWVDSLRNRLPTVNAPETFRFLSYLLKESRVDFSEDFRPFCTHRVEDIRVTAFYSLGQLKNKKDFVDLFIMGLEDASPHVVREVLQALAGIRDQRLPEAYSRLSDRFKTDEDYVLTNLKQRMKEVAFWSIKGSHRWEW
jgi:hypothetical protein